VIASDVTGRRGVARVSVWVDAVGCLRAIELLRIAVGPLTIAHLWPFLEDAVRGFVYSDRFYQPYFAWYPEVPGDVYVALLWLAVGAATAVSFGVATRWTAAYTAGFVAYNLFLSRAYFSHNRAFLLVMLVGVAVLPLGRWWSVDAALRAWRGREIDRSDKPLWPILVMRFEVVVVFLASGWSKLVAAARADWRNRIDAYRQHRPMVERSIAWLVANGHRRVRYRGVERNRIALSVRAATINLGLTWNPTGWPIAPP